MSWTRRSRRLRPEVPDAVCPHFRRALDGVFARRRHQNQFVQFLLSLKLGDGSVEFQRRHGVQRFRLDHHQPLRDAVVKPERWRIAGRLLDVAFRHHRTWERWFFRRSIQYGPRKDLG